MTTGRGVVGFPVATAVCIEEGRRRLFASALDWPGWCRPGRSEEEALEELARYAGRYAPVAIRAGVRFATSRSGTFEVLERLQGNATTDFGAPAAISEYERRPVAGEEAERLAALLEACWAEFDETVARSPAVLRKGPRGGGRDRDQVVQHVTNAERAYARKLGVRSPGDAGQTRAALLVAIRVGSGTTGTPWPLRYVVRRTAWHVLDHSWEIEDKATPGAATP